MTQRTFTMRTPSNRVCQKLAANLAKANVTVLYEVPSESMARIDSIWLCNVHNGNESVTVYHTRPGQSAATSNALFYSFQLTSNDSHVYDATFYMSSGDRLWISAGTADRICVTVYGEQS